MKQAILKLEKKAPPPKKKQVKNKQKTWLSFSIPGGQLDRTEEKLQQNWLKNKITEDKRHLYISAEYERGELD